MCCLLACGSLLCGLVWLARGWVCGTCALLDTVWWCCLCLVIGLLVYYLGSLVVVFCCMFVLRGCGLCCLWLLAAVVLCVCLGLVCCFNGGAALLILDLLDFIDRGVFVYFGGLMIMIDCLYLRFALGFRWFVLWLSVLGWLVVWYLIVCLGYWCRMFVLGVVSNCAFVCCVLSCV